MLPWYPSGDAKGDHGYSVPTLWHRLVANYAGLSLGAVGQLDYLQYLARLEQTESGREYLANAWRMTQTKLDRAALRRQFGSKEV